MKRAMISRVGALLLAGLLTVLTGCAGGEETESASSEASTTESAEVTTGLDTEAATESDTDAATETEGETETEHISPTEEVTSVLGSQIDTEVTLDRDSSDDAKKNYKVSLSNLMEEGDRVSSFTFVFYAQDGTSDIGTFKGGCGISVTEDCAAATDPGWFQSPDFSVQAEGAYVEVKWDVPGEVAPYIAASGDVQIGYWWGDTQLVTLKNVICSYTRTKTLPVDGTKDIAVAKTLQRDSKTENSVKVSLSDVLSGGAVPQAITFTLDGGAPIGKFTGAFGITTDDWYQTETIAVPTDAGNLSLTWILPEGIKNSIPSNAEVMIGYWWGEPESLNLQSISVRYSLGGQSAASAGTSKPDSDPPASVEGESPAVKIVNEIKVGWNLGNTLDCYDVDWDTEGDFETAWGNVKTTKAMIDTVKAAGFNAVRLPVSWADHMDENGNVEGAWMDRVQEVVDYCMDDGLYTILNVHHDDYVWIHPVKAQEAEVTAKYQHLWEQIAQRFQDYDTHLLFEGLNEPRMVDTPAEWTGGTPEEREVINHLLQTFVDTVRASGGKNAERTLIVTTHAASIVDDALNDLVMPSDDNLILSVHNYAPWKFTTKEFPDDTVFDSTGEAELDKEFDDLYNRFVSQGIPVIIGEFGAENKENAADRSRYYGYYLEAAAKRRIPCFIWDNGGEDSYGLLNREDLSWYDTAIMDAVKNAE